MKQSSSTVDLTGIEEEDEEDPLVTFNKAAKSFTGMFKNVFNGINLPNLGKK